ncbi:MAG: hypothetical protein ACYS80_18475 [Planctomycetota bacterium]|jgi:hypothetical protein
MITEKGIVPVTGGQYKLLTDEQVKDLHDASMLNSLRSSTQRKRPY